MNMMLLQKDNELNVVCSECNKNKNEIFKNQLYKCCICKLNIYVHYVNQSIIKDHILIDYELKIIYVIYMVKNIFFCQECNMNLFNLCEIEIKHNKNHNYSL